MITMEMVRNARLEELFFARIYKQLTWEEAEEYHLLDIDEEVSDGITPNELLRIAVNAALEDAGERTEEAVEEKIKEIKNFILSGLETCTDTILLMKNGDCFDVTIMEILSDEYEIARLEPLSKYATENDFEIVESDEGLVIALNKEVVERYLKDIEL